MKKRKKNIINRFKEREAWAIIIFIFSIIIFLSILTYNFEHPQGLGNDIPIDNLLGIFGVKISYYLMNFTIGYFAIVFPLIMAIISYAMFFRKKIYRYIKKSSHLLFIALTASSNSL